MDDRRLKEILKTHKPLDTTTVFDQTFWARFDALPKDSPPEWISPPSWTWSMAGLAFSIALLMAYVIGGWVGNHSGSLFMAALTLGRGVL